MNAICMSYSINLDNSTIAFSFAIVVFLRIVIDWFILISVTTATESQFIVNKQDVGIKATSSTRDILALQSSPTCWSACTPNSLSYDAVVGR